MHASSTSPIICAIDTLDIQQARSLAHQIHPHVGMLKLGLEFFVAHGPQAIMDVCEQGMPQASRLFLDLKFHDIPNTVAGAVRSAVATGCELLTIHASGGASMCHAAVDAAQEQAAKLGKPTPTLLGVTLLTSLNQTEVNALGYGAIESQVLRLAEIALSHGVPGLVCSPHEIRAIRQRFGQEPVLVVPGIRPAGSATGDQSRIMTPKEALDAGANWLVIGRPITAGANPAAAAAAIAQSL